MPLGRNKNLARLKFERGADMPAAYLPLKVPSEEGKPQAPPDARSYSSQNYGTPEGTRTPDPLLRRQLLYPPELQAHMERVMGIEPTRPAWKAGILPLNYTRTGADTQRMSAKE